MTQIGECPYDDCNESGMWETPEVTPKFAHVKCGGCHRPIWLYLSRLDPKAYTKEGFNERFIVDEISKSIAPR